jgi:hypothetical protein
MIRNPPKDKIAPWYTLDREEWIRESFLSYSFSELRKRMSEFPLTMNIFNEFLDNYIIRPIRIKENRTNGLMCTLGSPYTWNLLLGLKQSRHEIGITLVHEVIHGYYRCQGRDFMVSKQEISDRDEQENLIEEKAKHFYYDNSKAIDEIAEKLIKEAQEISS